MKYIIVILTIFVMSFPLIAGKSSGKPKKSMLMEKKWFLARKQKHSEEEMLKGRKSCELDNYVIFHKDGTYEWLEGKIKCDPNAPDIISRGKWKLDGKDFWMDGNWHYVMELTDDKFVCTLDTSEGYSIQFTYGLTPESFAYDESNSWDDIIVKEPIKVYYSNNCPLSDRAMTYFTANNIPFVKFLYDTNDSEISVPLRKAGYRGWMNGKGDPLYMPVMVINDKVYWKVQDQKQFFKRLRVQTK
jgi:hypothetical protein